MFDRNNFNRYVERRDWEETKRSDRRRSEGTSTKQGLTSCYTPRREEKGKSWDKAHQSSKNSASER